MTASEHWAALDSAARADAIQWARQMLTADHAEPPTEDQVVAQAIADEWAQTPAGEREKRDCSRAANAARAAYAARPLDCSECGQPTDHRARIEMPDGSAMCWRCASDGAEHTAAGRLLLRQASAAGLTPTPNPSHGGLTP